MEFPGPSRVYSTSCCSHSRSVFGSLVSIGITPALKGIRLGDHIIVDLKFHFSLLI